VPPLNLSPGASQPLSFRTIIIPHRLLLLGHERDAAGALVPGATISPQHQYNLAEMGLAWHENVEAEPEFAQFVEHIKNEIRGS